VQLEANRRQRLAGMGVAELAGTGAVKSGGTSSEL
jgi:hypothetical protein